MKPILFATFLFLSTCFSAYSQQPISGIINDYEAVRGFSCDSSTLFVDETTGFSPGDEVLIIQMQGASVDVSNTGAFGSIVNFGSAGNYEFNRIYKVTPGQIHLKFKLERTYEIAGKVQLVRVPEFNNITTAALTCKPWDGSTGGVLALDVLGELNIQGNMDVSGKGFRGGRAIDADFSVYHETQYFYPNDPIFAGEKGESIAILPSDRSYGRGKSANGGGGGNAHNAGGAGGGNAGGGGDGGLEYYTIPSQPTANTNGLAGTDVFRNDPAKIIMGGGGGSGHMNDDVGESGGNGGGIIFIKAASTKGNGFKLLTNGGSVFSPGDQRNDGEGGGGAGGSIVFNGDNLNDLLLAEMKGGNGGDCLWFNPIQIIGPGGGGGGGKMVMSHPNNTLVMQLGGGLNGIANQNLTNGAKPGSSGNSLVNNSLWPTSTVPVHFTELEYSFCPGDSIFGQVYTEESEIVRVLDGLGQCDSIVFIKLVPQDTIVTFVSFQLCPGEEIVIEGETFTAPGGVEINYSGVNACDSIVFYTLELLPQPTRAETIEFCAGESVTISGQIYNQSGTVIDTIAAASGCDTIVTYTLVLLPQPTRAETIEFCPGESVTIGGQLYNQSGTVIDTIAAASDCDTIVTYTLVLLPQPTRAETIEFCAGESVTIGGQIYNQSGTVIDTIAAASGCDTIVTYTLVLLPQPTRAETIEFCPGDTIMLGGQAYTQATVVNLTLPAIIGCDTLATYTLQSLLPAPSNVAIQCPTNISIIAETGAAPLLVNYTSPLANSNCPCPGLELSLIAGLPSGALFPNGTNQVCYRAIDACGNSATCCFSVTIREIQACDTKVIGCMKYELLSVTADADKNQTYRIRVTNTCPNKMIYTAIQLPDAVTAMEPAHLSTYISPGNIDYEVRNPNFTPFYSIRFKSLSDSIANSESDIFKFTLPAQSDPDYIHITSRLVPQLFFEAYLNTFYCPVGATKPSDRDQTTSPFLNKVLLFPNPSNGRIWIDMGFAAENSVQWKIFDLRGQLLKSGNESSGQSLFEIDLSDELSSGIYFMHLLSATGEREILRFALQR